MQRKRISICLILCLAVAMAGCGKKYVAHPGSLSTFDSKAYDALLMWNGALTQAKADLAAGKIPAGSRTLINNTGAVYNSARDAWLAYRAAARAGQATDAATAQTEFNKFQTQIESLIDQLVSLLISDGSTIERPVLAGDPPPFLMLERSTR